MNNRKLELRIVFDVDLVAWINYSGHSINHATNEDGRVGFWFPKNIVEEKAQELSGGKAIVEVRAWSNGVRRLHSDYLSPSAKAALKYIDTKALRTQYQQEKEQ